MLLKRRYSRSSGKKRIGSMMLLAISGARRALASLAGLLRQSIGQEYSSMIQKNTMVM
jgi:hypothetical protein